MSRGMGPGRMRGGMPGDKAKDFKGTLKKLIRYMSVFKVQMLFVLIFAVCGTIFNIVGPKILGKATTEIFNGLVSKVSGGSGMDFGKNRADTSDGALPVSCQRAVYVLTGNPHDRGLPEDNLPAAEGDFRED